MYLKYVIFCTWIYFSTGTDQQSSEDSVTRCCENKGVCVWGVACICDSHYYGRYCEYEINFNCSYVPHLYWVKSDCDLCQCYNGRFVCIPKYYFGCDDDEEPLDANRIVRPLEGKKIVLYDPERFNRLDHVNTSGQTRSVQPACLLTMLLIASCLYI